MPLNIHREKQYLSIQFVHAHLHHIMRTIHKLLDTYGESHQNGTNKLIHWVCVPAIMFSLLGLLALIPFPLDYTGMFANWAAVFLAAALLYYLRLSVLMFVGFIGIGAAMLWGIHAVKETAGAHAAWVFPAVFVVAWIGQFIGHKIEGKKPSFFQDLQFLLIGPAWLLHFIYDKLGIKY